MARDLVDERVDGALERVGGHDLRDETDRERLAGTGPGGHA